MYHRTIFRSIKQYNINFVIKILIMSDFVIWSAYQLLAPIFAIYISDRIPGGSIEVVGIAAALYLISKSIFEVPVGVYIDKSKSEKDDLYTAIFGTIAMAATFFLYVWVDSILGLYMLQVLFGIGSAMAYPGWYSIFTKHVDKGKEAFEWSLYDVLLGLGMAGASALGGFIANQYGFNSLFIAVGVFTIIGAILLITIKDKIYLK